MVKIRFIATSKFRPFRHLADNSRPTRNALNTTTGEEKKKTITNSTAFGGGLLAHDVDVVVDVVVDVDVVSQRVLFSAVRSRNSLRFAGAINCHNSSSSSSDAGKPRVAGARALAHTNQLLASRR